MKKVLSMLLIIAFVFSISGCGISNKSYLISYDMLNEPKNLDPQTASDQASLTVINNIYEGLFYINEFGEVKNALAKNMIKSENGLEYTIDIIDNAVWTNGQSVTANDFVFAFKRLFRSDTNSPAASQFFSIKNSQKINMRQIEESNLGVTALSDKRLKIELEYPNDSLEYLLATTYALPCNEKFFNETKGKYGLQSEKTLSNGAFDIKSWTKDESIKIRKSDSYHDSKNVKPAGVNLYISVEKDTDKKDTDKKDTDKKDTDKKDTDKKDTNKKDTNKKDTKERLLDEEVNSAFIAGNDINKFNKKGFNTEAIEDTTWGLYLNTKNKSLTDVNIRKAIANCFDRNSYSDKLPDNLSVANGIIPHSIMMFNKTFREYSGENITPKFDAKKAYEYYTAGLASLNRQSVRALSLLINKDAKIDAVEYFSYPSQIFQRELSLFINIEEVEEAEYNKRIQEKNFDIALYKLKSSDNSLNSIFSRFQSQSDKNFVSYSNPEYDNLFNSTVLQTDKSQIIAGYQSVEKKIIDDGVFIPMFYATDYFVSTGKTTGIVYNKRTGLINFKNAVVS